MQAECRRLVDHGSGAASLSGWHELPQGARPAHVEPPCDTFSAHPGVLAAPLWVKSAIKVLPGADRHQTRAKGRPHITSPLTPGAISNVLKWYKCAPDGGVSGDSHKKRVLHSHKNKRSSLLGRGDQDLHILLKWGGGLPWAGVKDLLKSRRPLNMSRTPPPGGAFPLHESQLQVSWSIEGNVYSISNEVHQHLRLRRPSRVIYPLCKPSCSS